jgi:hypothetical protein
MKATCFFKEFNSRPKVEMIRVAQNNFSVDVIFQFALVNGLNGAGSANRHKYRSMDLTVSGL